MTNPVDSGAVVDLLGALAYAELTAFDRLAEDARMAPTLTGRAALAKMAAAEIAHHGRLTERLGELGVDPSQAMAPFVPALDAAGVTKREVQQLLADNPRAALTRGSWSLPPDLNDDAG